MNDYDVKSNSEITLLPQDDDGIEEIFDPNVDLFCKAWKTLKDSINSSTGWANAFCQQGSSDGHYYIFRDLLVTDENLALLDFTTPTDPNSQWVKSNYTSLARMFMNCFKIKKAPYIDTKYVKDFTNMFNGCKSLEEVPNYDFSSATDLAGLFGGCSKLASIPAFKIQDEEGKTLSIGGMFSNCSSLKVIPPLNFNRVSWVYSLFNNCSNLERIQIYNMHLGFEINASTKFTREALVEILTNLGEARNGNQTLTMGATNLAKLTEDDIAIATAKGWTLA